MKRWKLILAAIWVLLLCACGNNKQVTGRAQSFEDGILTVQTEKGKTYDFLVEPLKTTIFELVSGDREDQLDGDCQVQVTWKRTLGQRQAEVIWVYARLHRKVMQLSDGTSIDLWERNGYRDYCLEDGTVLLMEETPIRPEEGYRWNELLYYEKFPEAAQQAITDYYANMGLRYDLTAILEDAWLVHAFSEEYHTQLVGQHAWVEAWNDRIICCQLDLTIPVERNNGYAESFREGAVFERETGEQISGFDLFTLTPEELEDYLLDFLDTGGTLDRETIQLNLKPEQIVLCQDGSIEFYLIDRVDNGLKSTLQMGLTPEHAREILQPWAVMEAENNS